MFADDLLLMSDVASGFAALSQGQTRERFLAASRHHLQSALLAKYGPLDARIESLSDDELLAELGAE